MAAGMVMAAALSDIGVDDRNRLRNLIQAAGLPVSISGVDVSSLRTAMQLDKKVLGKRLRFILLESLGRAFVSDDVSETRLRQVLAAEAP